MCGTYLQVTSEELRELIEKPDRYWEYAEKAQGTERAADIDKAWHALWYLTGKAGFEVDFVLGGTLLEEADSDGPPRYFTAAEVQTVSAALSKTGFDQLSSGVELAELDTNEIYPRLWDGPEALDYLRGNYEDLVTFFAGAAKADAPVITIIT
ncbi:YfbM family protein [Amycolatopsis sp. NPDC051071]|uniref:YfbM family protein n=1 Tax=Amycolatopsis sp. NPDC051071 TaxID=3154637 RepID=UPI003429203E